MTTSKVINLIRELVICEFVFNCPRCYVTKSGLQKLTLQIAT